MGMNMGDNARQLPAQRPMSNMNAARTLLLAIPLALLSACDGQRDTSVELPPPERSEHEAAVTTPENLQPLVEVYKTASCGCCRAWVEHMQTHGFPVKVRNLEDLGPIKERVGVPYGLGSCHTAEVGGYFIEGHVPANEVQRLLTEKPKAKGLVVPGMPAGSPGMEQEDGRTEPYQVLLVHEDGSTSVYASY
jgi:hypothetical protein